MAQTYPPLQILDGFSKYGGGFESFKNLFNFISGVENITRQEVMDFFTNPKFLYNPPEQLVKVSKPPFSTIESIMINDGYSLFKIAGYPQKVLEADDFNVSAEMRDLFFTSILWEEWSFTKQVFKPDMYFADSLIHTNNLQISKHMIQHLPCNIFYLDLSDCPQFGAICGVLVYINSKDTECRVTMYLVSNTLGLYSFYIASNYDEQNLLQIDANSIKSVGENQFTGYNLDSVFSDKNSTYDIPKKLYTMSRAEIHLFVLQMISYLSIDEPQITESDLTKRTYKPRAASAPIRNKWSEVKIDDVGVVYGKSFRKQLEEIKKDTTEESDSDTDESKSRKRRKSPAPHFRSAHCSKYWVGKGRTDLKVNWIEPTFVGAKQSKNVVIHTVE